MYKTLIIGIMSLLFVNVALAKETEPFRLLVEFSNSNIYVFTDPETQCEYLTYFYIGTTSPSLTPRLNALGKPMCTKIDLELKKPEAESFESVE